MKIKLLLILFLNYGVLNLINVSHSKTKIEESPKTTIRVKCYVELVGGSENISFWRIPVSSFTNFITTVVGQNVLIIPKPKDSVNKRGIIYKAKECILAENLFSSLIARAIENKIPR